MAIGKQAKLIKPALFTLGVLLLLLLIKRVGLSRVAEIIFRARPGLIIGGFLVYLLLILIRALKWFLLIKAGGGATGFKKFLPFYLVNCLAGNLSPMKSGEAATPFLLRKYLKIPVGRGFSVVILDRFFELTFFTAIFIAAAIYVVKSAAVGGTVLSIFKLALAVFILLISFLFFVIFFQKIILKILARLKWFAGFPLTEKILEFIVRELQIFYESLALYKNQAAFGFMAPLTLIGWLLEFLSFYLVFYSVAPASFLRVASAQILAMAATLASFIPGGIGLGELGVVYILNLYGYSAVASTAGVVLVRLILTGTLVVAGISGTCFLKEKVE